MLKGIRRLKLSNFKNPHRTSESILENALRMLSKFVENACNSIKILLN